MDIENKHSLGSSEILICVDCTQFNAVHKCYIKAIDYNVISPPNREFNHELSFSFVLFSASSPVPFAPPSTAHL